MKIGAKLRLCFGVIILIMLALSAFSINRFAYTNTMVKTIINGQWAKTRLLNIIRDNINNNSMTIRNAIIIENAEDSKQELAKISERTSSTLDCFKQMAKMTPTSDEKKYIDAINENREKYKGLQKEVVALIVANQKKEAGQLLASRYRVAQSGYTDAINDMISFQEKLLRKSSDDVEKSYHQTFILTATFLGISILLSVIFAYFVTKSITVPVEALVCINDRIADGDLTVVVAQNSGGEIGQLADSSRKVVDKMHGMLTKVAEASRMVASASQQLQTTARQIAGGTEEVASQTGTVVTASEEMAATSSDIARNCNRAAESSKKTSDSATKGSSVVKQTIQGMSRISERVKQSAKTVENLGARSEQIGEIVGTIEDIADQTNLLALNAAIEAARAGEQGRGFAVVADEVRALAERTTKATKEISDMIRNIQNETRSAVLAMEEGVGEVERGSVCSEESGRALEEILEQINEVTSQIHQIATAADEQTATTNEITNNIHQMTAIVQETARGANDTASASMQLSENAQLLQKLVSEFKIA